MQLSSLLQLLPHLCPHHHPCDYGSREITPKKASNGTQKAQLLSSVTCGTFTPA